MFKLNFKIALRNLWKYKTYTFINIAGLAIGMASCILIFIFIRYELSFDDQFVKKDRIYRVVSNWTEISGTDASQGVPVPLAKAMRNDFPQLEKVAAIQSAHGIISTTKHAGRPMIKEAIGVFYAEPDFFGIFNYTWLAGNPDQVLNEPNTVVLCEEKATQYFGDWRKAVGQTLRFQHETELRVTGVFKDRGENNSLNLPMVISYANYPGRKEDSWSHVASSSECYVLLKDGLHIDELQGVLAAFNTKYHAKNTLTIREYNTFQPLKEIHYDSRYGNFAGKTMERKQIYGLSVIGIFLLLTACINFINLATAQAVNRSKEVGIRKVMGSGRKQLVLQFLGETLTISTAALLIACVLTEMALPYMQNLFSENISFSMLEHPVIFVFLVGLVFLVSALAGFYPALIMSGFSPALAIKNKVSSAAGGGMGLRRILVVFQFTITVVLIICTLMILKQMNYIRQKPLGFNPNAVALVNIPADSLNRLKQHNFKDRLLTIPGVKEVSFCDTPPSSGMVAENRFSVNGIPVKDFQVRVMHGDRSYFETFGLKMIAGQILPKSDTANAWVVNQTFLKKMNIASPELALGKLLKVGDQNFRIVGVMKDFNDKSLHEEISPLAISSGQVEYYNVAVKMDQAKMVESMKAVEHLWNSTFPDEVYDAMFVNDDLNHYYQTEIVMETLFKNFSMIIIFISFIGLFGLISFVASQRTREVAIRKVLGATNLELVRLLNGSFLLMVFLANLLAWPIAYLFINRWLAGYAYRINVSIWPFAIAMVVSMGITLITVSFRSFKAAKTNPIDALKYE